MINWVVTRLYDIDPGPDCPEIVRMIVEIPQHSANKYEYDGELGVFSGSPAGTRARLTGVVQT